MKNFWLDNKGFHIGMKVKIVKAPSGRNAWVGVLLRSLLFPTQQGMLYLDISCLP